MAERLSERHAVDVLTTCARDNVTWKNDYAEGADRVRGVTVRRFANSQTRDIADFNRYSDWIFENPHTTADEMEWLKRQGPWSPGLIDHLKRHHKQYDALIFFNYLYAPTVLGLQVDPGRSILVPAAHDEPPVHLDIYRDVFRLPNAIGYLSDPERLFVTQRFERAASIEETIGCGVDLPPHHAYPRARRTARIGRARPRRGHARRRERRHRWRKRPLSVPRDVPGSELQTPSPHSRTIRALRRTHRSGQGLRGADRILQHVRRRRW